MNYLKLFFVFLIFIIVIPVKTEAEPVTIRSGLYQNPPKIFTDANGNPAGIFPEILQEIADREDWNIVFEVCEWEDCLEKLEQGRIDLMPDVALNEERSGTYLFHDTPVLHSWSGIWTRPEITVRSPNDLNNLRVALLQGSVQEESLKNLASMYGFRFTPVFRKSFSEAFDAVAAGSADAVSSNIFFAGSYGSSFRFKETPITFNPSGLYFAASVKTNPEILKIIDSYINLWKSDPDSPYYKILRNSRIQPGAFVFPAYVKWLLIILGIITALLTGFSLLLRKQIQKKTKDLREANEKLTHFLKASPAVLYQIEYSDGKYTVKWVSGNAEGLVGYSVDEIRSPGWWESVIHPEDKDQALRTFFSLRDRRHIVYEYRVFSKNSEIHWIRDEMKHYTSSDGRTETISGSWNDISAEKERELRIAYYSSHDTLTGLMNRSLLKERLTEAVRHAAKEKTGFALFSLDLDRFKMINETLGFDSGDEILRSTALRLGTILSEGDLIARAGGDEFVLLFNGNGTVTSASETAEKILDLFRTPYRIQDQELLLHCSIGVSLFPADSSDPEMILKNAEIARYAAKTQRRNRFHFFGTGVASELRDRLKLEAALKKALDKNEIYLVYQPQISLLTGEVTGAEALVRWNHPEFGEIPPGIFIPLAEQTHIILDLGSWILRTACNQVKLWDAQGFHLPRIAVNLSARQIEADLLVPQIQEILSETGIDPDRLELELTESALMNDPEAAMKDLTEFRREGISLALDDFGTGYSSLAYLKNLPINILKIDKSFVMDTEPGSGGEAMCRAVIHLASVLNLKTIAEGIETEEQLQFLTAEGCTTGQGFYFSRPVLPEDLPAAAAFVSEKFRRLPLAAES